MKRMPTDVYLEKARNLTKQEAEHLFARMGGKLERRVENRKLSPLDAAAIQLEIEEEALIEWRKQWGEITEREITKSRKKD